MSFEYPPIPPELAEVFEFPARRFILWQYWQDPLDTSSDGFVNEEDAVANPSMVGGGDFDEEGGRSHAHAHAVNGFFRTPVGPIPAEFDADTLKGMEFWLGHADFHVTEYLIDLGKQLPGVESLEPVGPHTFRLAVAKAFLRDDPLGLIVRRKLERVFGVERDEVKDTPAGSGTVADKLEEIRWDARSKKSGFAAIVMPNGRIVFCIDKNPQVVDAALRIYQEVKRAVGGELHSSKG